MHDAPAFPHAPNDDVVHTLPAQHPPAHDVASHTHWPFRQRCPLPQAAEPPQAHAPALHPSEVLGSQATHAAPPVPHAVADGLVQAPPAEQQPLGQELGPHVAPSFVLPSLEVPSFETPSFETPSFETPSFETPSFE